MCNVYGTPPAAQVLMVDADSLPLLDPNTLFEDPRFQAHGRWGGGGGGGGDGGCGGWGV